MPTIIVKWDNPAQYRGDAENAYTDFSEDTDMPPELEVTDAMGMPTLEFEDGKVPANLLSGTVEQSNQSSGVFEVDVTRMDNGNNQRGYFRVKTSSGGNP